MHGHDGCCAAPASTTTETMEAPATQTEPMMAEMGGCSSGGCGCGNSATMEGDSCGSGGCSDGGCGPGSETEQRERAALQGFLTGLYVANLKREKMAEYFDNLAKAEGTEFQRPAQFLASVLTAMPSDPAAPNAHKPASTQLLEFITGETVE